MKNRTVYVDGTMGVANKKEDIDAEIQKFLSNGGKVITCKEDDGKYDRQLKKTIEAGGFNPFSKAEALEVKP